MPSREKFPDQSHTVQPGSYKLAISRPKLIWLTAMLVICLGLSACSAATPTNSPTNNLNSTATLTPPEPLPSPTTSPQPTKTSQPTRTPSFTWNVTAIPVQHVPAGTPGWKNDQIARFYSSTDNEQLIDAATGKEIEPTPHPTAAIVALPSADTIRRVFSPDRKYFLECLTDVTRLYRSADIQLLSEAPITLDIYSEIAWAPDSLRAVSVSEEDLYFWYTDGRAPKKVHVGWSSYPTWSPQGDYLALITESREGFVPVVVDIRGNIQFWDEEIDSIGINPVGHVAWITNSLFEIQSGNGACCGITRYFDAKSGRRFPPWGVSLDVSHPPSDSPNWRWQITDTSYRGWKGEPFASPEYSGHKYKVANFETGQYYTLVDGGNQYLDWVGWSPDSRLFYFISRPSSTTALNSLTTPFGFLVLNPATFEVKQLFEQAVFAKLSPNQKLAWVIFPAKRADGSLGLGAGIFDLAAGTLTARQSAWNQMVYQWPTGEDLFPVAWSNDSTRLAWGDAQGNLLLISADGESQQIASGLPTKNWPLLIHYAWSPSDRLLLARYTNQAWIANMPLSH